MKQKIFLWPVFVLMLLWSIAAHAQPAMVTGTVSDAQTGEPLIYVSINVVGTTINVSTDENGVYTIQVNDAAKDQLNFSFIGYDTQTLPINGRTIVNVQLAQGAVMLDELVVVGYGVQKKSHLTGAISKFKDEKLSEIPVSSIEQALQGKIPGVSIQSTTSEVGVSPQIRVRGMGSISASSSPLVVVDGVPMPDGMNSLSASDIESLEVLKDAASAAIYGSRAANGVIMVTTKSGQPAKAKYSISASVGVKTLMRTYDIMTMPEYMDLLYRESALRASDPLWTDAKTNLASDAEKATYIIATQMYGEDLDWQKEGLRDIATIQNYQMSVSGGTKEVRYYLSGNYMADEGIMQHNEYNKLSFRAKLDANLGKYVKVGANVAPSYSYRERPGNNFTDFTRWFPGFQPRHNEITAAFTGKPVGSWAQMAHFAGKRYIGVLPDGEFFDKAATPSSSSNQNPKSVMENINRFQNDYRMSTSAYLQIEPIKDLIFRTNISNYVTYTENNEFRKTSANREGDVNKGYYTNKLYVDILSETTLNYTKEFGRHEVGGMIGFTYDRAIIKTAGIAGTNFPSDDIKTINAATEILIEENGVRRTYTLHDAPRILVSYFGRLNYSFADKYLASASLRTDGSSSFGPDNRWGWFPSVSLGWRLSEEPFMKSIDWISQLKLRGSWGVTGNDDIPAYSYTDLLLDANYILGNGTGKVVPGLAPNDGTLGNRSISWEQTYEYNAGVDFSVLNDRAGLTIDYYYAITDKLLLEQSAMAISGYDQYWNNIGRVRNLGVEIELHGHVFSTDDFKWELSYNMAFNKNKLIDLGGEPYQFNYGERSEVYAAFLGSSTIQYYGYKTNGVWISQQEIDAWRAAGGKNASEVIVAPGGLKVVDTNGDGELTADDRVPIGSPFPDFTYGLTNTFRYKDFDLTILFQGVYGVDVINGDINYNEFKKYEKDYVKDRWVSPSYPGDGKTPYFTNGMNVMLTDYVVEDGSYTALRDLTLGYTLPKKIAEKFHLRGLRAYFSAQNLLYFYAKGYRGLNPEARNTSSPYNSPLYDGYQRGAFPIQRTFSLGLEITF
jgi:TonB-linked SusC/RagA family outer membrane protein